jgi:prepilin-type N-terminal cleavage/methylation domain-containing protein
MINKFHSNKTGFTLIEIMIVVAIIALLAAIAVPSALRARKRSQATSTLETLRVLDAAADQYAIEYGQSTGAFIPAWGLMTYIKADTTIYNQLKTANKANDALGNAIAFQQVDVPPMVPISTQNALSDVADSNFWGSYYNSGS